MAAAAPAAASHLGAAAPETLADKLKKTEVKKPLTNVELEGHALLKIVQHCQEALPRLVTGQLLGLDVGQTLEITDCFPFPATGSGGEADDEAGASYQLDMMRCLREVNVDNNTVGWYQSTMLGSYQTVEFIETFVNYHENIKKCVCVVYDPYRSSKGTFALKAIRLKDTFIEHFKQQKLSTKDLREVNLLWRDVFQEVPVKVHNSSITQALLANLDSLPPADQADFDRLNLFMTPFFEKTIQSTMECVDDLLVEQQKVSMYHRNVARQAQLMAAWLQKRKQENQARRTAGEEALPEEDPAQFKPITEPPQLDNYLITNQISNYCDQINVTALQGLQKMFVMEAFHKGLL